MFHDRKGYILLHGPGCLAHESHLDNCSVLTLKVLVRTIDALGHLQTGNYNTVGGDGGCRIGEVQAGTTSPMPV